MNRIVNVGNLPNHLQIFAKQLGGVYDKISQTEFYEMESIKEIETKAVDIGYEIIPAMDMSTNRGFLVGFDAEEPKHVITGESYAKMKIYFVETNESEFREWVNKIKSHKEDQIQDMMERRQRAQDSQKKKLKAMSIVTGKNVDDLIDKIDGGTE